MEVPQGPNSPDLLPHETQKWRGKEAIRRMWVSVDSKDEGKETVRETDILKEMNRWWCRERTSNKWKEKLKISASIKVTHPIKCPLCCREKEGNRRMERTWWEGEEWEGEQRGGEATNGNNLFLSFSSKVNQIGPVLYDFHAPPAIPPPTTSLSAPFPPPQLPSLT